MPDYDEDYTPFDEVNDLLNIPLEETTVKPTVFKGNHQLLKLYDRSGKLLYITRSVQLQKLSGKDWFKEVTNITIDWYPDAGAAENAKIFAMDQEAPQWNQRKAFS